jgi:hypothetical protein
MGAGLQRAFAAARRTNLTPRQAQVLKALDDEFARPDLIAARAGVRTSSPRETAAKYCIQLVTLGLAEKGGTPAYPKWRKALHSKNQ